MSPLSPKRPGLRRARAASALAAALALLLNGCMYGFTGGGLPPHVRTVFIEPFDNATPYLNLTSDVQQALQNDLPRSLGVRLAPRAIADAVIRGRIADYREIQANVRASDSPGKIDVLQAEVQIQFEAEIYDVKEDKPLYRATSQTAIGTYNPDREQISTGRAKAVTDMVQKMVQGAQSQW